ncbi:MAG: plasmid pRiA4b ORF-3 family protein [Microgenomates group bacterium Gr01-1014_16]|nr:MAG: plasmid pRiA4b ORF-3 family protein [Microgenomates group bacterium Gr01-1014_16]
MAEVDRDLRKLISDLGLVGKMTIDDIKNVIYHENDKKGTMKLVNGFMRYAKKMGQFNRLTRIIQTAWNYLPHWILGGLSPYQMTKSVKVGKFVPEYDSTKTAVYQLFEFGLPQQIRLIKLGRKDEWGFELGSRYLEAVERLEQLTGGEEGEWDKNDLIDILRIAPSLLEGISLLARTYYEEGETKKARETFAYGVKMTEDIFPPEFVKNWSKLPWAFLENRNWLSFLLDQALFIAETEGELASIPYLEQVLTYNPNDNQGVRGILATKYLKVGQPAKTEELARKYPDDMMPEIILGRTLALFKLGKAEQADDYLDEVIHDCMNSVIEVLKGEHREPAGYDESVVTRGGDDEAYAYWLDQGNLWQATPGAVEWLRGIYERHRDCAPFPIAKIGGWVSRGWGEYIAGKKQFEPRETLIFRVKLEHDKRTYRDIEMAAEQTLEELSRAIGEAFEFGEDHLHAFFLDNRRWSEMIISDRRGGQGRLGERKSHRVELNLLILAPGQKFLYLYDFGDEWLFEVEYRGSGRREKDQKYPRVVKERGKSPEQYE